jgi:hypothetical protein
MIHAPQDQGITRTSGQSSQSTSLEEKIKNAKKANIIEVKTEIVE